jgi:hypothetical protein
MAMERLSHSVFHFYSQQFCVDVMRTRSMMGEERGNQCLVER